MENDTPEDNNTLNVVAAASRFGHPDAELVHMRPQLPIRTALTEASAIMAALLKSRARPSTGQVTAR